MRPREPHEIVVPGNPNFVGTRTHEASSLLYSKARNGVKCMSVKTVLKVVWHEKKYLLLACLACLGTLLFLSFPSGGLSLIFHYWSLGIFANSADEAQFLVTLECFFPSFMLVYFMSDCMHEFISHSMHVLVRAASVRVVAGMLALALAISILVYLFVELGFVLLLDSVTGMLPKLSLQDLALYLAPGFLLRFLTFFTIILVSNCIVFVSGSHLLGLVPITLFLIGLLVTAGYKTLAAAQALPWLQLVHSWHDTRVNDLVFGSGLPGFSECHSIIYLTVLSLLFLFVSLNSFRQQDLQ